MMKTMNWVYDFKDGTHIEMMESLTSDQLKNECKKHGEVIVDFKVIDPEEKECNMCDSNRDDWECAKDTYDAGTFGKYELSMAVSDRGIAVEFCRKGDWCDLLYSVFNKGIKYCPYCGRKLNIKEDK